MAQQMAEEIEAHNAKGKKTVFICLGGLQQNQTGAGDAGGAEGFPDPLNVGYIPELIEKLGGVEIAFDGIGINGHVAFNEVLEDMPHYCVTIGNNEIAHARKIRLGCFRNWNRAVVRRTGYGDAASEFPVTLLQNHPDITLTFTDFAAALES